MHYEILKLEWKQDSSGWRGEVAYTHLLNYSVLNDGCGRYYVCANGRHLEKCDSLEDGKAVAEKHYVMTMELMLRKVE